MAMDLDAFYANAEPADADYPQGSAKNIVTPGDNTGFPFEKEWVNDNFGFQQKLLLAAGITPSGSPDTVLASQYFEAMQKVQTFIDVTAFGAVGDGVTDDTAAIAAAVVYAQARNADVWFPTGATGTYVVSAFVPLSSNAALYSQGATIQLKTGSDSAIFAILPGSSNIHIQGLTLDGNAVNNAGTATEVGLIQIASTSGSPITDVLIENCTVSDAYRSGIVALDGTERLVIRNCLIDGTTIESGINLSETGSTVKDVKVENCKVTNCGDYGIEALGTLQDAMIADCLIETITTGAGFGAVDAGNVNVTVSRCIIRGVQGGDAVAIGATNAMVLDCTLEDYTAAAVWLENNTGSPAATLLGCRIAGNSINTASGARGILATNAKGVVIANNTFNGGNAFGPGYRIEIALDVTFGASDAATIIGNYIDHGGSTAIILQEFTSGCTINGCHMVGAGGSGTGVQIGGGAGATLNNIVSGCCIIQEAIAVVEVGGGTNFSCVVGNRLNLMGGLLGANSVLANNA